MIKKIIFAITFIFCSSSYAQSGYTKWYMGKNDRVLFDTHDSSIIYINIGHFGGSESYSMFYDSIGNVRAMTDGWYIVRVDASNLDSLDGYTHSSTQGTLVVPFPFNPNKYILFTTAEAIGSQGLRYSLLDMSLNGGKGALIVKNQQLYTPVVEKLTAVKHGNGRDWWVLAHEWNSNIFIKYLVTPEGIQGPFKQGIGTIHQQINDHGGNYMGSMGISENGVNIVSVIPSGIIDLFDINRCSGVLTNFRTYYDSLRNIFNPNLDDYRGDYFNCAFSKHNKFLYINSLNKIYQFLVDSFPKIKEIIWENQTNNCIYIYQMQRSNEKIYITNCYGKYPSDCNYDTLDKYIGVIEYPDSAGKKCSYKQKGVYLQGFYCGGGLPNNPNYTLGPLVGSECDSLHSGIEEKTGHKETEIEIYPNPAKNYIFVKLPTPATKSSQIILYDIMGKEIPAAVTIKQNGIELNVTSLSPGLYVVKYIGEKQIRLGRFVKE